MQKRDMGQAGNWCWHSLCCPSLGLLGHQEEDLCAKWENPLCGAQQLCQHTDSSGEHPDPPQGS